MARKFTRITSRSQSTFSWWANFHCQSGRRTISTRATIMNAREPRITTP